MKFRCAVFCLALLAALPFAHGQGADERYVQIYNVIQEADALNAGGQTRQAVTKYKEAQTALKNLQTTYPGWQEKVINYRLNYINSKLEPLIATPAISTNVPPAAPRTNAPPGVTLEAPEPGLVQSLQDQLKAVQGEVRRLTDENALLQAKVKEALTVQPGPTDPRELAKAQEKIRDMQKEIDLLKVALEQAKSARPAPAPAATDQEKQNLDDLKQVLSRQADALAALQKENDELKLQNAKLQAQVSRKKGPAPSAATLEKLTEELVIARLTISALQATNTALRTELLLLEKQLTAAQPGSQLSKGFEKLETELEVARARLEVYESKPIPYAPEELALFKQPDSRMVLTHSNNVPAVTTNGFTRKNYQPPAGAGGLFSEAQRAAEAGRFDEAEQKFVQVLRQDENNVYTLSHLAAVQMDLKRWDDAEKNLKRALVIDPKEPATLLLLGRLKYTQEKYDEAFDALSLSASLVPNDFRTQYFLGKTLIQKGNRQQAEKALRRAVQLKPNWGEAHYSLAIVYATQQPPFKELAQWHYEKALRAGIPPNPDLEKLLQAKSASAAP